MLNLVGQTVRFSSRNKYEPGQSDRSILINEEFYSGNMRYYHVSDKKTGEAFPVHADIYDQFFLVKRSAIAPKKL